MKSSILLALLCAVLSLSSCSKNSGSTASAPTDARDKFVGDYTVSGTYSIMGQTGSIGSAPMTITKSTSNSTSIFVGGYEATVNGNNFTFKSVTSSSGGYSGTFSGSGSLSGSTISYAEVISTSYGDVTYNYSGTKK